MSSDISSDEESFCFSDFSGREFDLQSEASSVSDDDDATLTDCSCCTEEDLEVDWDSLYVDGYITVAKYMQGIQQAAGIKVTKDSMAGGNDSSETEKEFKDKLANLLRQMMFVSGETAEPSVETTTLIEEIVRQQVVEIVSPPSRQLRVGCSFRPARPQHRVGYSPRSALYLH